MQQSLLLSLYFFHLLPIFFTFTYGAYHRKKEYDELILLTDDWKNNVSTVAVLVYGVLSPYLAQYLSADQFSALCIALVSIVLVLYSAKHPNTFKALGNGKCDGNCNCEETVMNEEYEIDPVDGDEQ